MRGGRRAVAIAVVLGLVAIVAGCTESNEEAVPPVDAVPEVLAVIGAGQSDGSLIEGDDLRELWARRLYQELPRETVYVNLAAAGSTVASALETQVPDAVDLDPATVLVWLVTGDADAGTPVDEFGRSLSDLVQRFGPDTDVLLLTGWAGRFPERIAGFIGEVRNVASDTGATLVDISDIDSARPDAQQQVADAVLDAMAAS